MDTERAVGIVLRRHPVTESSLIVTWFTREFGKLRTLAKGARRAKGPFQGKIDLFYQDEIVFLPSKRSDLHLLHDCFLETTYPALRGSVEKLTAASYVCELVEVATEWEDPNPRVYQLLADMLGALSRGARDVVVIWFELQLLRATGWAPVWNKPTGADRVVQSLAKASLAGASRVRLDSAQSMEARQVVWRLWDQHVGTTPRTRKYLAEERIPR